MPTRRAVRVLASAVEASPAKGSTSKTFKQLQNGSDIRGIAIEGAQASADLRFPSQSLGALRSHLLLPLRSTTDGRATHRDSTSMQRTHLPHSSCAGVEGETRNLTPKIAYFIGVGFAKLLSNRFSKPADQLKVSVSTFTT